jgi:hypothetical protein
MQTKLLTLRELCRACVIKRNGPHPIGLLRTPITCDDCGAESDTAYYLEAR